MYRIKTMHFPAYYRALLLQPNENNKSKLIVAWDYDQCLSKVVAGDYAEFLLPLMQQFFTNLLASNESITNLEFCSYSNRISEFFNAAVKKENKRINLTTLQMFAAQLKIPNVSVKTDEPTFLLDGDKEFSECLKMDQVDYGDRKRRIDQYLVDKTTLTDPDKLFIRDHSVCVTKDERAIKKKLYSEILYKAIKDGSDVLFIDDKMENLDFIRSTKKVKCYTLKFHGTQIGSSLKTTKKSAYSLTVQKMPENDEPESSI